MRIVLMIGMAVAAFAGACGEDEAARDSAELSVVATTTVLGNVVSSIVGDDANVSVLIPRGADPHEFQASARQAAALRTADLIVANGLGLEAGAETLLDDVARDGNLLEVGPQVDPRPLADGDGADDADPHVWLDPGRMADAARLVGDALAEIDTSIDWKARSEAYASELDALDVEVEQALDAIPAARRVLVTNHDVLGYFAERYSFDVVGIIIRGGGTSAEPSARDLEELARQIERENVPAIFAETSQPRRLAEALRQETGVDIEIVELYTESVGAPGSGAETYAGMMRANATRIAKALSA